MDKLTRYLAEVGKPAAPATPAGGGSLVDFLLSAGTPVEAAGAGPPPPPAFGAPMLQPSRAPSPTPATGGPVLRQVPEVPAPAPAGQPDGHLNEFERAWKSTKVGFGSVLLGNVQNTLGEVTTNPEPWKNPLAGYAMNQVPGGGMFRQPPQGAVTNEGLAAAAETGARQLAGWAEGWIQRNAPADPKWRDGLYSAIGSMASIAGPAAVVGLLSGPGGAQAAAAMAESSAEQGAVERELILRYGISAKDAHERSMWVFAINLPMNYVLDKGLFRWMPDGPLQQKLLKATGAKQLAAIIAADMGVGFTKEAVQEGGQEVVSTVAVGDKPTLGQVGNAALIGGLVGGGMTGLAVPGAAYQRSQYLDRALDEGPLGPRPQFSPWFDPNEEQRILAELMQDPQLNPLLQSPAQAEAQQVAAVDADPQTHGATNTARPADAAGWEPAPGPFRGADDQDEGGAPRFSRAVPGPDFKNVQGTEADRISPVKGRFGATLVGYRNTDEGPILWYQEQNGEVYSGNLSAVANMLGFSERRLANELSGIEHLRTAPARSPTPRMSRAPQVRPDSQPGGEFDWRRGVSVPGPMSTDAASGEASQEPSSGFYLRGMRVIAEEMPDRLEAGQLMALLKARGVKDEEVEYVWRPMIESRTKQGQTSIDRAWAFNWGEDLLRELGRMEKVEDPEWEEYTGPGANYEVRLEMRPPGGEAYETHFHDQDLAHVRTKDVTDADGNSLRMIEELQSDIHQAAKEIVDKNLKKRRGYSQETPEQKSQRYAPEPVADWEYAWGNVIWDARHTTSDAVVSARELDTTKLGPLLRRVQPEDLGHAALASTEFAAALDEMAKEQGKHTDFFLKAIRFRGMIEKTNELLGRRPEGALFPAQLMNLIGDVADAVFRANDVTLGQVIPEREAKRVHDAFLLSYAAVESNPAVLPRPYEPKVPPVPDAPHKESWKARGLKRAVIEAVRDGRSGVAMTTGAEQTDRNANMLRGVAKQIAWYRDEGDLYVAVTRKSGKQYGDEPIMFYMDEDGFYHSNNGGHKLDAVFGKELAQRIISEEEGSVEGDEIIWGGEGFQHHYDKVARGELDKIGRPFGTKTQLGDIYAGVGWQHDVGQFDEGEGYSLSGSDGRLMATVSREYGEDEQWKLAIRDPATDRWEQLGKYGPSDHQVAMADAEAIAVERGLLPAPGETRGQRRAYQAHIMPFTQALIEAVEREGLPLFKRAAKRTEAAKKPGRFHDGMTVVKDVRGTAAKLAVRFAKKIGVQVVFVKDVDFDGKFVGEEDGYAKNTVFVNIDSQMPLIAVIAHESIHYMRRYHKDLYEKIYRVVQQHMTSSTAAQAIIDRHRESYLEVAAQHREAGNLAMEAKIKRLVKNDAAMFEEVIGDLFAEMVSDKAFWSRLAMADQGAFATLKKHMGDLVTKLREVVASATGSTELRAMLTSVEAVETAIAEAAYEMAARDNWEKRKVEVSERAAILLQHQKSFGKRIDITKARNRSAVKRRLVVEGVRTLREMDGRSGFSVDEWRQWYREDMVRTYAILERELPGISNDPQMQKLLSVFLAITSPQTNAEKNFGFAVSVMRDYLATGKLPIRQDVSTTGKEGFALFATEKNVDTGERGDNWMVGGKAMTNVRLNAEKLVRITESMGGWRPFVDWLSQKHTHDEFVKMFGSAAPKILKGRPGEEKPTYIGAMQYGPKVGVFFENLAGHHNAPVQDLWFTAWAYARLNDLMVRVEKDGDPLEGEYTHPAMAPKVVPGKTIAWEVFEEAVALIAEEMSKITGELWGPDEVQAALWGAEKTIHREFGIEEERVNQYHLAALDRARRSGYGREAEETLDRIGAARGPRRLREAGPGGAVDGADADGVGGAQRVAAGAGSARRWAGSAQPVRGDRGTGGGPAWDVRRVREGDDLAGRLTVAGHTLTVAAEFTPSLAFEKVRRALGIPGRPTSIIETTSPQAFHDILAAAKAANKAGAAVTLYDAARYAEPGTRMFLFRDGSAGFAITADGDIISVFKHKGPENASVHCMLLAVALGGRRLDCFNTVLPGLYAPMGFRVAAKTAFADEFAPEGWFKEDGVTPQDIWMPYNNGRPDVVFMVYDGGETDTLFERYDTFPLYDTYAGSVQYSADYDAAAAAQLAELAELENTPRLSRRPAAAALPGPASQAIAKRAQAKREALEAELSHSWRDRWHAVRRAVFDRGGSLDWRLVEALRDNGFDPRKILEHATKNPYVLMRLLSSAPSMAAGIIRRGVPKVGDTTKIAHDGLDVILARHKINSQEKQDQLDIVLVANQLEDYQRQRKVRRGTTDPFVAPAALAEYLQARSEILAGPDGAAIRAAAAEVAGFNTAFLNWCKEMELVSPALFVKLTSMYARWVPIYEMALIGPDGAPRSPTPTAASGVRTAYGFDAGFVPASPIESIQRNVNYLVAAALENRVKVALAMLAPKLPGVVDHVRPKMEKISTTRANAARMALESESEELTDEAIIALLEDVGLDASDMSALRSMWRVAAFQEKGVIAYRKNGKVHYLKVDPAIYQVFYDRSTENPSELIRLMSAPTRWFRAGVTSTLGFAAVNLMRDVRQALVFGKTTPTRAELWRGLVAVVRKNDDYWDWVMANGGSVSPITPDEAAARVRRLNQGAGAQFKYDIVHPVDGMRHLLQLTQDFSSASDAVNRIPQFLARRRARTAGAQKIIDKKARPSTLDIQLGAAMDSRQPSLDFQQGGTMAREANRLVTFLNARLLGRSQIFVALKERPRRTITAALLVYTLPTIGLWLLYRDEEWYKRQPDWMKYMYHIIPTDSEGRNLMLIPKGQEMAYLFSSAVEAMLNAWNNDDPDAARDWAERYARDWDMYPIPFVSGMDLPQIVKPYYEAVVANNNEFKNAPVVSSRLQAVRNQYQYDASTPEITKWLAETQPGRLVRLSPKKLEHLIGGYFGTMGKTMTNFASDIMTTFDPSRRRPVRSRHKLFGVVPMERTWFVNRFFRSSLAAGSVYMERFDRYHWESTAAARAMKLGMSSDRHRPDKLRKMADEDIADLMLFRPMNKAADDIQSLMDYVSMIESEPEGEGKFTADEKRDIRDARIQEIDELAKVALSERKKLIAQLEADPGFRQKMVDEILAGLDAELRSIDEELSEEKRRQ